MGLRFDLVLGHRGNGEALCSRDAAYSDNVGLCPECCWVTGLLGWTGAGLGQELAQGSSEHRWPGHMHGQDQTPRRAATSSGSHRECRACPHCTPWPVCFSKLLPGPAANLNVPAQDWCGPCKLMEKELVKLTAAFPKGVKFAKFNCGDHQVG